jgi:hypothetical protein
LDIRNDFSISNSWWQAPIMNLGVAGVPSGRRRGWLSLQPGQRPGFGLELAVDGVGAVAPSDETVPKRCLTHFWLRAVAE